VIQQIHHVAFIVIMLSQHIDERSPRIPDHGLN
jgi:hypothetical protein